VCAADDPMSAPMSSPRLPVVIEEVLAKFNDHSIVSIGLFIVSVAGKRCIFLQLYILAGFLLGQSSAVYDVFALNLTQIGVHIWTLVTFWLFEPNIIVLLGNVLCIHLVRARVRSVTRML
jgi:hypothetical protein